MGEIHGILSPSEVLLKLKQKSEKSSQPLSRKEWQRQCMMTDQNPNHSTCCASVGEKIENLEI